ncbi:MAG: hypothetical protein JO353_08060 [Phycisphaerae bacterium]|nr:hypothetical protein [Phycisphaerae bacterium]
MKECTIRGAIIAAVLLLAGGLLCGETPSSTQPSADAPTTVPSTQSAAGTIKGKVALSDELAVGKPDLTRIVVYLASDPVLDAVPHAMDHATVEQRNKSFIPNFTVVPRNTDVEFPNWDDFDHNVFSRSKAAPAFDLDRYPKGQSKSRVFDKIGVVQIFCNIHPSMRAIIYVTPNVYYTRCDAAGRFVIPNVPPGDYTLQTWNERCGESGQPVHVASDATCEALIALTANHRAIVANDLKSRDRGYGVERGLGVKREQLNLPVVKDSHAAIDPEK